MSIPRVSTIGPIPPGLRERPGVFLLSNFLFPILQRAFDGIRVGVFQFRAGGEVGVMSRLNLDITGGVLIK